MGSWPSSDRGPGGQKLKQISEKGHSFLLRLLPNGEGTSLDRLTP